MQIEKQSNVAKMHLGTKTPEPSTRSDDSRGFVVEQVALRTTRGPINRIFQGSRYTEIVLT